MKIFIDIGHPAHVHYFRNFISEMRGKGHDIFVSARDKEITHKLLIFYAIEFYNRGKGRRSLLGKLFYLLKTDFKLWSVCHKWNPDLFLSFGSPYAAHMAKLSGRPHIALTDTDNAKLGIFSFAPFSTTIITPRAFLKSFGKKQIRFDGYFELSYLHPKYYKSKRNIREILKLGTSDKFAFFRFVSWNASHDIGQSGIRNKTKLQLINLFIDKGFKVFISSECEVLKELLSYKINTSPEEIHSVLEEADFVISEGATMATEAALLGTPSIYINSIDAGIIQEEAKFGLLYSYRSDDGIVEKVNILLSEKGLKAKHQKLRKNLLSEKIEFTSFLIWFVEHYPETIGILKKQPDFQKKFVMVDHN